MDGNQPLLMELRELLSRLQDDELDAGGFQRIEEIVNAIPLARELYVNSMLLSGELRWASGGATNLSSDGPDGESANEGHVGKGQLIGVDCDTSTCNGLPDDRFQKSAHDRRRTTPADAGAPLRWLGWAAVAAALLISAATYLWQHDRNALTEAPSSPDQVAVVKSDDGCIWSGGQREIAVDSRLFAGERLGLSAGVAKLSFEKGSMVVVESPATFELVSATSLRLLQGTVAVRAGGEKKEFVVISPDAEIVDLGTCFAVHYDGQSSTEVEVYEGAVELFPEYDSENGQVLELGANVSVGRDSKEITRVARPIEGGHFSSILETLWPDVRSVEGATAFESKDEFIEASFSGDSAIDSIDTFYGSRPGKGWVTSWVGAGNLTGQILKNDSGFEPDNPFLSLKFSNAVERAIAREYGAFGSVHPTQPHVISWRWRLDGDPDQFGGDYHDRVAFYGNPFFRRNSWPTNSWLIGVASDHETLGHVQSSTTWLRKQRGLEIPEEESQQEARMVFPGHWYLFDNKNSTASGAVFDRRNMVDTGLELKFDTPYCFAIAVYPQEGKYDVAIRDDRDTVVHTGLSFRDKNPGYANVVHFSITAGNPMDDLGFSLDNLQVRPVRFENIRQELDLSN